MDGLIVDSFAGGGGASVGLELALGRPVDIAINHSDEALAMHAANHPATEHYCRNIWQVDPADVVRERGPIAVAWFSPDCTHHSKAKGGAPIRGDKARSSRDLAWVVVQWAQRAKPAVILLENVEEFEDWSPVYEDGKPKPDEKGLTFKRWIRELRRCGYKVEWKRLRACDYGAPTIRQRLYLIARRDGEPIVWPEPTHAAPTDPDVIAGRKLPYRTAAECIDWSIPCPSIFLTKEEGRAIGVKRPLADNTMARIARGVKRYVIDAAEPFIVPVTHRGDLRGHPVSEPLRTVTTAQRGEFALVAPHITKFRGGATGSDVAAPMPTVTANSFVKRPGGAPPIGVVAAFLAQHNTGMTGHHPSEPVSTIVGKGCTQAVVAAHLMHNYTSNVNGGQGDPLRPMKTVTAGGQHHALVYSFLMKYYGTDQDPRLGEPLHTVTTKDRFGLVTVPALGPDWYIADIGMRMLDRRELFAAQGFPADYIVDPMFNGKPLTKTAAVRCCGNSVCPPVAAALARANVAGAMQVAV